MAKSIKSFNANEQVLGIIEEEKPTNVSEWVNNMIIKGHAQQKQVPDMPQRAKITLKGVKI